MDTTDDPNVVFVEAPFVKATIADVAPAARGAIVSFTSPATPASPVPEGEYSRQIIVAGSHADSEVIGRIADDRGVMGGADFRKLFGIKLQDVGLA
ncbi:hypothetical protein [Corynebacterium rouxii]|uniref:hypothetical protein n=1 Tax=Corynebacterium rouxii TaxID=2719119 RepID=UPI00313DCF7F